MYPSCFPTCESDKPNLSHLIMIYSRECNQNDKRAAEKHTDWANMMLSSLLSPTRAIEVPSSLSASGDPFISSFLER